MRIQSYGWLIVSLILVAPLSANGATGTERGPNVLFITVDDMNSDLGAFGHPQVESPNIDRLAERGVCFDHAYAQFPLCNPSRISMLTGLRPGRTHIYDLKTALREKLPDAVTLPQQFQKHGYFVARVGKIFHYGVPDAIGTDGLDDPLSWQKVVNPRGRDKDEESRIIKFTPRMNIAKLPTYLAADGTDDEQTDGKGAAAAIALMEANKDRQFFLAVGFYRPHVPYIAPKKYFDLYPLDSIAMPRVTATDVEGVPKQALDATYPWPWFGMTEPQAREAKRAYYSAISFVDAMVGRVLDALERLKLADNTIVVFLSDNGYHLGEHGLWAKQSLFEEAARVPLIFAGPGVSAKGQKSSRIVEFVDIYPTLADLAGLPAPKGLDGVSLRPLLGNPKAPWHRPAYTELYGPKWTRSAQGRRQDQGGSSGRSVRTERWRYTEWSKDASHGQDQGVELYDHDRDPQENHNLAKDPKQAKTIQKLKALIRKNWRTERVAEGAP